MPSAAFRKTLSPSQRRMLHACALLLQREGDNELTWHSDNLCGDHFGKRAAARQRRQPAEDTKRATRRSMGFCRVDGKTAGWQPELGENPKGLLIFDGNGRYSSTLIRSDIPKYASNNRLNTTPAEDRATVQGSIATVGTYTINEGDRSYTIQVDGSTYPNWNGTAQKRTVASVSADELKSTTPRPRPAAQLLNWSTDAQSKSQHSCGRLTSEKEVMKLPRRRQFLQLAAGAAALPLVSRIARAQAYPSRPVRWIVGFPPGGGADTVARIMAQWLSDRFGQQVIVENRPGASTNIAAQAVINSPPDGHTLLFYGASTVINTSIFHNLPFDVQRDIAPVSGLVAYPWCWLRTHRSPPRPSPN